MLAAPISATVVATPATVGARPAVVDLKLRYEMQCGYPGPGPVVVTFPAGFRLPPRLAAGSVRVDGKPAPALAVRARKVRVPLRPKPGILCDSITEGTLHIAFGRAAGIRNPLRAGTYGFEATRGTLDFAAKTRIRR
jgi:hypothetical protein